MMSILRKTYLYKPFKLGKIWLTHRFNKLSDRDQKLLDFYSRLIHRDGLCFDIGANVGDRTNIFLKLGARVVAFEPQEACAHILKGRFLGRRNLLIIQSALGDHEHETTMHIATANTISSMSSEWISSVQESGRFGSHQWIIEQKVRVTTLDNAIVKYGFPDFIKIDVEGYEKQVLDGLSQPVPLLSFEYTPELHKNSIDCISHMRSIGSYVLNFSKGESGEFQFLTWKEPDEFMIAIEELQYDLTNWGDIYMMLKKNT